MGSRLNNVKASCHPDKPHMAKGLCSTCYSRKWVSTNPEQSTETKRRWRKSNPTKVKAVHRRYLYKVEPEVVEQRMVEQGGLCAVCKIRPATDLDHDHETSEPRGLLCGKCNRGLGLFGDSLDLLSNALNYLSKWKPNV